MEYSLAYDLSSPPPQPCSERDMKQNNRIKEIRMKRGWSQKKLAMIMGISQGQVNKLENSNQELKASHMLAYSKALGVAPIDILPRTMLNASQHQQTSEAEAETWTPEPAKNDNKNHDNRTNRPKNAVRHDMIAASLADNPRRSAWVLRSQALDITGHKAGDIVVVDADRKPSVGDIVCAQLLGRDNAKTVFRIYQPPYLVTASTNPRLREPQLIDPSRVTIMGTVTETLRFS